MAEVPEGNRGYRGSPFRCLTCLVNFSCSSAQPRDAHCGHSHHEPRLAGRGGAPGGTPAYEVDPDDADALMRLLHAGGGTPGKLLGIPPIFGQAQGWPPRSRQASKQT